MSAMPVHTSTKTMLFGFSIYDVVIEFSKTHVLNVFQIIKYEDNQLPIIRKLINIFLKQKKSVINPKQLLIFKMSIV